MEEDFLYCKYSWLTVVESVLKQLDGLIEYYSPEEVGNHGELVDDLIQLRDLGRKLISGVYFEESDNMNDNTAIPGLINNAHKYLYFYDRGCRQQERDRKRFFRLLGKYSKEWK